MKYKVGDKVRVRNDLIHGERYGGVIFYMDGWKGRVVTISYVCFDYYKVAEDLDKWDWSDEMFEDINKKYKVGDKVKIREDLVADEEYGEIDYISDMDKWKGKVVTISFADSDNNCYGIAEDTEGWNWSAEMFEDVPENNVGEIKVQTVDVGYYLTFCGQGVLVDVYQDGAHDENLFFTSADGFNQYILPKDAIKWVIPHEKEIDL